MPTPRTSLARHPRNYDKGAQIEEPADIQGLLDDKRAARQHTANDRLAQAAPASQTLLMSVAECGANLGAITAALARLLERYGAAALQDAILEALARDVPHPSRSSASASNSVANRSWRSSCPHTCATEMRQRARMHSKLTITSRISTMQPVPAPERDTRRDRAAAFNLHGRLAHWSEVASETWVLLGWEEQERARRSLERRLRTAHIGRFKLLCDFDWAGPTRCDSAAVNPSSRIRPSDAPILAARVSVSI